jgi:hypothetical protein
MQKLITFFTLTILILFSGFRCDKEEDTLLSGCLKGKLEIRGICMNYVISIKDGTFDPALIDTNWKDPVTGNTYFNAFALGSVCDFPDTIKEGDEFYFNIVNKSNDNCAVCLAYRPVPEKHLQIKVSDKPCN